MPMGPPPVMLIPPPRKLVPEPLCQVTPGRNVARPEPCLRPIRPRRVLMARPGRKTRWFWEPPPRKAPRKAPTAAPIPLWKFPTKPDPLRLRRRFLQEQGIFCLANKKMSTSQAAIVQQPKQFPFAKRGATMIPKPKFDMHFHVTALNKYSKKIPKREPTALDHSSVSDLQWWDDTRRLNGGKY